MTMRSRLFFIIFACTSIVALYRMFNFESSEGHRFLLSRSQRAARTNLRFLDEKPSPSDSILFWHIPKSGGTSAKSFYQCLGKVITTRVGVWPQFGYQNTNEIVVFKPFPQLAWKTVNVDTTNYLGIRRAKEMELAKSHTADVIFSLEMGVAAEHLFDSENKGRILALFRHPIHRLVSKFYYLQIATWEKSYRPEWKDMTLIQWARSQRSGVEANFMVQKISGKPWSERATEEDLQEAKRIVKDHIIVGLLSDMQESFRRFNIVMGVDESLEMSKSCMNKLISENSSWKNSNEHPQITSTSPEWNILAKLNDLDMRLFRYIETLFADQKSIIDSYLPQALYQKNTLNATLM